MSDELKPCTTCGNPARWLPYVGGDDDPARAHVDDDSWADFLCERSKHVPAFQVCGHPLSEMYQDDDTTPYCTACVKEARR